MYTSAPDRPRDAPCTLPPAMSEGIRRRAVRSAVALLALNVIIIDYDSISLLICLLLVVLVVVVVLLLLLLLMILLLAVVSLVSLCSIVSNRS